MDDPAGFREFAEERTPALYRSAFMLTGSAHDAQDLVQETLAKVFVAWTRESPRDPVAYSHVTLTRTFISRQRRKFREIPSADTLPRLGPDPETPIARVDIITALRALKPNDRAVLVLRFLEDYSIQQTAEALRISPASVKTRAHRAATRLRRQLGPNYLVETSDE